LENLYKLTLKEYKNVFNTLYSSLCIFANKYLDNSDLSKDIVQEVFIKLWEKQVTFQSKDHIKSFLYTSVRNKALDVIKSPKYKKTQKTFQNIEKIESKAFFLREVVVVETSQIIEKAINTLPKRCAQIIKLSLKEYSNAQIAEELSISINTIKAQKKIAYKKLRPLLRDYYVL